MNTELLPGLRPVSRRCGFAAAREKPIDRDPG